MRRPDFYAVVESPRLMGDKSYDAKLSLSYTNIDDTEAVEFIETYNDSFSGFFPLNLPVETVSGIDDLDLATRIQTGQHLVWFFEGPPDITSVFIGVSSVRVNLTASLVRNNVP